MKTLLSQSTTVSSPLVVIPLLGVAVDVTTHLKGVEEANSTFISGQVKVINGRTYLASFNGLSDRDHHPALELRADGPNSCTIAYYGSMFTIGVPSLNLAEAVLDVPHGVHQNAH